MACYPPEAGKGKRWIALNKCLARLLRPEFVFPTTGRSLL
jgi:hypothetical protein